MKTIPLTQGKVALVDDSDYRAISKFKWHARKGGNGNWYAVRPLTRSEKKVRGYKNGGGMAMHRHLLIECSSDRVDHKDGNGLNNQRSNLRFATIGENNRNKLIEPNRNSSGYKGVSWVPRIKRWRARIKLNKKEHWGGYFYTAQAAAKCYDKLALRLFGEFARTNQSMGVLCSG